MSKIQGIKNKKMAELAKQTKSPYVAALAKLQEAPYINTHGARAMLHRDETAFPWGSFPGEPGYSSKKAKKKKKVTSSTARRVR